MVLESLPARNVGHVADKDNALRSRRIHGS